MYYVVYLQILTNAMTSRRRQNDDDKDDDDTVISDFVEIQNIRCNARNTILLNGWWTRSMAGDTQNPI